MTAPMLEERRPAAGRRLAFLVLLLGAAWGLGAFAAWPWEATPPDAALLKVAIKRVAPLERAGRRLSPEELEKLPRHMRPVGGAGVPSGRRRESRLAVWVDGQVVLDRRYRPGGWRGDGPTFAYVELPLAPGRHRLEAILRDARDHDERDGHRRESDAHGRGDAGEGWRLRRDVDVGPGRVLRLEFSDEAGLLVR